VAGLAAQHRLEGDVGHLGVFSLAYYQSFADQLRPLEITQSATRQNCIFPSPQTVTSAAYPLSRQLLITTSLQDAKRGDVRDFLLSYLHNAQRLATQQGLVALPEDVLTRETAFFATGEQNSTGSSSAANVSTDDVTGATLPSTVH
jgi:hypothetical protein